MNNIFKLPGRPMQLEMVARAPSAALSVASRLTTGASAGAGRNQQSTRGARGSRGGARGGRGGAAGGRKKPKSAEELDAEMSSYMNNASF